MLQKIIRYFLIAALFIPLLYTPFTLYPSYYGKTAIFQLIIGIAFLLYLILLMRGELKKPKFSFIFYLLAIYLGIRIITGFLGIDAEKSFWGTQSRMGGNFTWLHFFIFFFLLTQFFESKKDWYKLIKIAVFASFLVALTGILQRFGIAPFEWWTKEGRISGVIGNSIPFASYILFSIWLGILVFHESIAESLTPAAKAGQANKSRISFRKYIANNFTSLLLTVGWGIVLAANITALFWSGTRGAIYIFIASIPLAIFLFGVFSKKRIIRLSFLLLILFFLIISLFFTVNISFILGSNTIQTRLLNWEIAYQGWIETPRSFLIGYGTENYDKIFDKYYNPEFLKYSFYETVGDKPHNILLEVVNASGILGLLAYLGIFVGVIWTLIICAKKNRVSKSFAIILSLAFLTYLGQNLAEFDSTNVLILFFLGLGLVSSVNQTRKDTLQQAQSVSTMLYTVLFIIVCLGTYFGTIQPIKASYYTLKSKECVYENQEKWGRYAKKALEYPSIYRNENRTHIANSAFFIAAQGLFNISQENLDSLKILHEKLGESVLNHPSAYEYKHRFAQVESMLGEYVNQKYFDDAEKTFRELDAENHNRQAIGLAWGQMRMIRGDVTGAVEILQKVVDKNPEADEPRWYLGLTFLEAGEKEKGILELGKSVELGGFVLENLNNIELLVALWEEVGEYGKIASIYEELSRRASPLRATWLARLAATYAEMGEIEKAIETIEEAVILEPSLIDEAREFVESLQKD